MPLSQRLVQETRERGQNVTPLWLFATRLAVRLTHPAPSMSQAPVLVEGSASPLGPALAESAKRALLLCQPFTMLKLEHYDQWKDIELKFDPHELLGG